MSLDQGFLCSNVPLMLAALALPESQVTAPALSAGRENETPANKGPAGERREAATNST